MDDGPVFRTPAEDLVEADRRTRRPSLVWSDWASAGTDDPGGGGYLDAVSVALAVWLVISVAVGFLVAMLSSNEAVGGQSAGPLALAGIGALVTGVVVAMKRTGLRGPKAWAFVTAGSAAAVLVAGVLGLASIAWIWVAAVILWWRQRRHRRRNQAAGPSGS